MLRRINNVIKEYREYFIFLVLLIVFTLVSAYTNGPILFSGFIFIIYQISCILLPGMALLLILNLKKLTRLEFLIFSYCLGFTTNILFYYLSVPFHLSWLLYVFLGGGFITSVIILIKYGNRIRACQRDKADFIFCIVIIILLLIYNYFSICSYNMLPTVMTENGYSKDTMHWIGITEMLMKGYPPYDFRYYGQTMYYHFGSSMQLAVESYITHIDPPTLAIVFSYFQPAFMAVIAMYTLFRRCIGKRWLCAIFVLVVIFGKCTMDFGIGEDFFTFAPLGYDASLAIMSCLLTLFIIYHQHKIDCKKGYVLCICFFPVMMLLKIAPATVFLLFVGLLCLRLVVKGKIVKAISIGFPLLLVFLILYFGVIDMKKYTGAESYEDTLVQEVEGASVLTITGNTTIQYHYNQWMSKTDNPLVQGLVNIIFLLIYMFSYSPIILLPAFICFLIKIFYLRSCTYIDTCMMITIVGGCALSMYLKVMSNTSFVFTTQIFGIVIILNTLKELYETGKMLLVGKLILAFVVMYNIVMGFKAPLTQFFWRGFSNRSTLINENLYGLEYESVIEEGDYEVYQWVKENTPYDAVIINNKNMFKEGEGGRPIYVAGVFTERYSFFSEDTARLFRDYDYSVLDILRSVGVNYIICDIDTSPEFFLLAEEGDLVFTNAVARVYYIYEKVNGE